MELGIDFSRQANFRSRLKRAGSYIAAGVLTTATIGCDNSGPSLTVEPTPRVTSPTVTRTATPQVADLRLPRRSDNQPISSNPDDHRFEIKVGEQHIYTSIEPAINKHPDAPGIILFIGRNLYCPPQEIPPERDFCAGNQQVAERGSLIIENRFSCVDRKPELAPPAQYCKPQE